MSTQAGKRSASSSTIHSGFSPRCTRSLFTKQLLNRRGNDCHVGPAPCGVSTTFESCNRGLSPSIGSCAKTSRPAPSKRPSRCAVASASSSTRPPRAVFTTTAEGFNSDKDSASIRLRVFAFNGTCTAVVGHRQARLPRSLDVESVVAGRHQLAQEVGIHDRRGNLGCSNIAELEARRSQPIGYRAQLGVEQAVRTQ